MTLAEKVLIYRATHNLSLNNMAKLCNVSAVTLLKVEKNRGEVTNLVKQKILNVIEKE